MEILINSQLPVITGNFAEIKEKLALALKEYEVTVTEDNLAEAKKMATELNKMATEFDRRRKEVEAEATKPIKAFKDQCDDLVLMCKNGRTTILLQVQVFEDKRKAECLDLLKQELLAKYTEHNLDEEYRHVDISDLAILSNITSSGSLAKAARDQVDLRVKNLLMIQEKRKNRIIEAENLCLKSGIEPFTKVQLLPIIDKDDFSDRIAKMVEAEKDRQAAIEAVMRKKIEAENAAKEAVEKAEAEAKAKAEDPKPVIVEAVKPVIPEPTKPEPASQSESGIVYEVNIYGTIKATMPGLEGAFKKRIKEALEKVVQNFDVEVSRCK
jgi:hypothetical protein